MLAIRRPQGRLIVSVAAGLAVGVSIGLVSNVAAGPAGGQDDITACRVIDARAEEYGSGVTLVRAELATAGDVVAWQEHRYDELPDHGVADGVQSPLRSMDADEPIGVCIYHGSFVTPVGPPGDDGAVKPPHDLLRLLVLAGGSVIVDAAGYVESGMKPETPGDWAGSK